MFARLRILGLGAALAVAASASGCGGGSSQVAYGRTHAPREPGGIDLTLTTHDGRIVELADQRGAPVLLFLFATYDGASLATARGLARFTRDALETIVIAVALQPDAETFTRAYVESQSPPYTVAYDPRNRILRGLTDLGPIDSIPTLIMIDARGREVGRQSGYVGERVLSRWREEALARGGVTPPPAEAEAEAETAAETSAQPRVRARDEAPAEPESDADVLVIEPDDP